MKKDFFNGNIKHQFISYIWTTIIIAAVALFGSGGFFIYLSFSDIVADRTTAIFLLCFGVFAFLFGIWYFFGTIFIIRSYPKYKKFTKWFLNSDAYFVESTSKEYHGHWRGKAAFDRVMLAGEQNKGFENIKYPKTYRRNIIFVIISIVLMWVIFAIAFIALENADKLPKMLQNEMLIFCIFILVEIVDVVLAFVFAFRVKRIRKETKEKYEYLRGGWRFSLYFSLKELCVRTNEKKRKYWYNADQLEKIETMVSAASDNAKLNVERKSDRLISFTVVDERNYSIVFTGFFI